MLPKVLIVCANASKECGGESILPLHYFSLLSKRLPLVCLLAHERTLKELRGIPGIKEEHLYFIPDTFAQKFLYSIGKHLPERIAFATTGALQHLVTQFHQWRMARKIIKKHQIDIVHETTPVSPKQPSAMFALGVPVIIGPMNGGMSFPPSLRSMSSYYERILYFLMRNLADFFNLLIPGKVFAKYLLVANERTKEALPRIKLGKVLFVVENGVFSLQVVKKPLSKPQKGIKVLFVGRLVDIKAVDILIDALGLCQNKMMQLVIAGDGPEMEKLKSQASRVAPGRIDFTGWISHASIDEYYDCANIFVMPSLRECGGAAVLEAMSRGLPVIASKWGGPADYLTPETGVLIDPISREFLVKEFARQMDFLASDQNLRNRIGEAAIRRVSELFTWEQKVEKILEIYSSITPF